MGIPAINAESTQRSTFDGVQKFDSFFIVAILFFTHEILSPWFYIVRITNIVPQIGHVEKLYFMAYICAFTIALIPRIKQAINPLALMSAVALAAGIVWQPAVEFDIRYYGSSVATLCFVMVATGYGKVYGADLKRLLPSLELASAWIAGSMFLAFGLYLYLELAGGYDFYPSFNSEALLVPLIFTLLSRRHLATITLLLIVFLSGKRGPTVAYLAMAAANYLWFNRVSLLRLAGATLALGVVLVVLVAWNPIPTLSKYTGMIGAVQSQIVKLLERPAPQPVQQPATNETATPTQPSAGISLDQLTSGRSLEIEGAYALINDGWAKLLLGAGLSAKFDLTDAAGEVIEQRGYVHFSPANFILKFGLIIGGLYAAMVYMVPTYQIFRRDRESSVDQFFVLSLIALLIISLTAYILAYDPLLWCGLGFLYSRSSSVAADKAL